MHDSYDYWTLRTNGDFYGALSYFEDERTTEGTALWADIRIGRIAEAFLFLAGMYQRLGVGPTEQLRLMITHSGLSGRILSYSGGSSLLLQQKKTREESHTWRRVSSTEEMANHTAALVEEALSGLFVLFDYYEISASRYAQFAKDYLEEFEQQRNR